MTDTKEITFTVTNTVHGYNHDTIYGTFTGPATVKDVEDRFYHFYFGGRNAWVKDGKFGCIVHGCD